MRSTSQVHAVGRGARNACTLSLIRSVIQDLPPEGRLAGRMIEAKSEGVDMIPSPHFSL